MRDPLDMKNQVIPILEVLNPPVIRILLRVEIPDIRLDIEKGITIEHIKSRGMDHVLLDPSDPEKKNRMR